jgi:photosystem II stability/assembly factor-like uncharacterized protein
MLVRARQPSSEPMTAAPAGELPLSMTAAEDSRGNYSELQIPSFSAALQTEDGIYRVAISRNWGRTWSVITVDTARALGPAVQSVGFIDETTGWIGGFFDGMYETRDGGRSWQRFEMRDRSINRFVRVGPSMVAAGSRGVLRYHR